MIVLSGCVMRQQKIESEDQKAADAAAAAADAAAEILAEKAMPRIAAEQKRKEEECAANSMPVRGRMLSALVVKSASLYREASSQSKAIASLTLGEQIKVEESSAETLGADGRRWAHVEASHLVDCSPHGNVTGWLDMAAIAEEKEFKSVGRWDGPTRLDVEFGDWVGTYYFAVDGTYRSDEYRGNLYEYGDVVMGRAELNGQKVIDVFIRVENKGICWELDQSYCQK
jgi:hypothetical protein